MKIVLAMILGGAAFAADCTSAAAGVWSNPGSWANCNGDVPGNGDTATLSHAITLDGSRVVGTSPSADTAVLTINNGGRLIWVEGAVLTVRGSIRIANPSSLTYTLEMAPGGGLHFDPSLAADRTQAAYTLRPSAANSNSVIRMICTAAQPCTVQTLRPNGDEARARFAVNGTNSNFLEAEFVDFQDLGSPTTPAFEFAMASSAPAHAIVSFQWCRFRNVGFIGGSSSLQSSNGHTVRFNHNYVESLLHTTTKRVAWRTTFTNVIGTGIREVIGNVLPDFGVGGDPSDLACRGCIIRDNFFRRTYYSYSAAAHAAAEITNNYFGLAQDSNNSIAAVAPQIRNNYIWWRAPGNPHILAASGHTGNITFDGNVFEVNNTNDGDVISKGGNSDNEASYVVTNNLMIPSLDFYPSNGSALVTVLCGNMTRCGIWTLNKNTMAGGGDSATQGRCFIGFTEGTGTPPGPDTDVVSVRSNIIGGLPGTFGGTRGLIWQTGTTKVNTFQPGGITNNGWFGRTFRRNSPGQSSHNTVYDIPTGGADPVPGANDLVELPFFADPTRNSARWAASKGYAESWDGVKQVFINAWVSNRGNPAVIAGLVEDVRNWVRQGFAPRNLNYASHGHDGGRIGAVPPITMFGTFNGGY
jgi:hypothetical protein